MRLGLKIQDGRRSRQQNVTVLPGQIVRIGSDPQADFVFQTPGVDSEHATLQIESGQLTVRNVSLNGTFVNGGEVDWRVLTLGDTVSLHEKATLVVERIAADEEPQADQAQPKQKTESKLSPKQIGQWAFLLLYVGGGIAAVIYLLNRGPSGDTASLYAYSTKQRIVEETRDYLSTATYDNLTPPLNGVAPCEDGPAHGWNCGDPAKLYTTLYKVRQDQDEKGKEFRHDKDLVDALVTEVDNLLDSAWLAHRRRHYNEEWQRYRELERIVPDHGAPVFSHVQRLKSVVRPLRSE